MENKETCLTPSLKKKIKYYLFGAEIIETDKKENWGFISKDYMDKIDKDWRKII